MAKKDYFSIKDEVALGGGIPVADPSEKKADTCVLHPGDLERLRDSTASEPALSSGKNNAINQFIVGKGEKFSVFQVLLIALAAGITGGVFAVPGCFISSAEGGAIGVLALTVFAPILEEVLKQSGMIYLLEKRPWLIKYKIQFIVSALSGGITFSVLENLIYRYVYLASLPAETLETVMSFRWTYCVILHISCCLISSIGLYAAWKKQHAESALFSLQDAFRYFAAAAVLHGSYNLLALFIKF